MFGEFLGNQEILRVMGQLRDKIHRVIFRVFTLNPERMTTSFSEHQTIADAVINGDPVRASQLIEQHLKVGKDALLSPRRL